MSGTGSEEKSFIERTKTTKQAPRGVRGKEGYGLRRGGGNFRGKGSQSIIVLSTEKKHPKEEGRRGSWKLKKKMPGGKRGKLYKVLENQGGGERGGGEVRLQDAKKGAGVHTTGEVGEMKKGMPLAVSETREIIVTGGEKLGTWV